MNQLPNIQPPQFFLRFFRWFCDPAIVEDIEGDLTEIFRRDASSGNISKARLRFSLNTVRLFRPGIIKKFGHQSSFIHPAPMFKNYFITSMRSLMRSKERVLLQVVVSASSADASCFMGLSGLLRTARQENPQLYGQCLQLPAGAGAGRVAQLLLANAGALQDEAVRYLR